MDSSLVLLLHCIYTIWSLHWVTFLIAHLGWSHAWVLQLWNWFLFHRVLECTVNFFPLIVSLQTLVWEEIYVCFFLFFFFPFSLSNSKCVLLLYGGWCEAVKCHQRSCIFKYQGKLQHPAVLAAFILMGEEEWPSIFTFWVKHGLCCFSVKPASQVVNE